MEGLSGTIILILVVAALFYSIRILREYERGVVFQLGRFWKVKGPGLVIVIPGIQQMVKVDSIVDEVTAVIKSGLEEKQITIVKELNAPFEVFMDSGNVREALLNILTNAVHAIGSNGKIVVRTYKERDSVVIEVKDTGSGIPEEALPFIFDPFFTTKGSGSTGLGLTITHKIIEKHKGKIEVESKPNAGSTFRIFLPLKSESDPH